MEKREFIVWLTAIILVTVTLIGIIENAFEAVENGRKVQRARIEVCKTVENEGLRVLCMEHARNS